MYAQAVKQKVLGEAENVERYWGETPRIRRACEARALGACVNLTQR